MTDTLAFGPFMGAANLVHDAALRLAADAAHPPEAARFLGVAARLGPVLESRPTRPQILAASPRVVERSGRVRTLVEMIEGEEGDDDSRLRLAKLLLRALSWVAADPASAREAARHHRDLIRHRRRSAGRAPDGLRDLDEG